MKDHARGFVIVILLMLASSLLYVGSEGVWYLTTDQFYFPAGSTYRTVYAPLDWAGDRWPPVYEAREELANAWLRLGGDSLRRAKVVPSSLPVVWYTVDDVQYLPPEN